MYFFAKPYFLYLCLLLMSFQLSAQEKKYFQQTANYTISASLDAQKKLLQGECLLEYKNNSQEELSFLWFHLWTNAYSDPYQTSFAKQFLNYGDTDFYFSTEKERGGYQQIDFISDNQSLSIEKTEQADIVKVILLKPLKPTQSITLKIPFLLKVPKNISRMGYDDKGGFHFCQWFPKPAVYDRDGWHPIPYLEMGEYYSEFGNYTVKISLPKDYIVAATGIEIEKTEHNGVQTMTYRAEQVHDFAWFADKRFEKKTELLELRSGKKVLLEASYPYRDSSKWKEVIRYMRQSVQFFSSYIGDYPYPKVAVVGSDLKVAGGMEYPMITIVRSNFDTAALNTVIAHEIAHNWFYGALASNERDFPFLDEGFTKYMEEKYVQNFQSPSNSMIPKFFRAKNSYSDLKNFWKSLYEASIPDMKKDALHQSQNAYVLKAYSNVAVALQLLEARHGEDKMKAAFHQLWNDWAFRHPYPTDFQKSIEKELQENLDWLFRDFIQDYKTSDYRIGAVNTNNGLMNIELQNRGALATPMPLWYGKTSSSQKVRWMDGFTGKKNITIPSDSATYLNLDKENVLLEQKTCHHSYHQKTLLKRAKPIHLSWFDLVGSPDAHNINITPVLNYNVYDGLMPGLAIWKTPLPRSGWEYYVLPFYSFTTQSLTGEASLSKYWYNTLGLNRIELSSNYRSFHYNSNSHYDYDDRYQRWMGFADFKFLKKDNGWQPSIQYQTTIIQQHYGQGIRYDDKIFEWKNRSYYINALSFIMRKEDALLPATLKATIEQGEGFGKLFAHYHQTIKYTKPSRLRRNGVLRLHFFAGTFLYAKDNMKAAANFRLNGTTGFEIFQKDYMFSQSIFGRNAASGFWSQQTFGQDAQLHTLSTIGTSRNYLVGISISDGLPLPIPIRWYADAALYPDAFTSKVAFGATAGLSVPLIKDILEVNFPIWNSQQIKDNLSLYRKNYWQTINFTLNFKKLNPIQYIREI